MDLEFIIKISKMASHVIEAESPPEFPDG